MRTRHNIMLYMHCVSCLKTGSNIKNVLAVLVGHAAEVLLLERGFFLVISNIHLRLCAFPRSATNVGVKTDRLDLPLSCLRRGMPDFGAVVTSCCLNEPWS
jgi:hypothetical protein